MSTRTDPTYDDATTSPRTDPVTDTTPTKDAGTHESDALTPNDGTSWTEQCKRQFSSQRTARMQNLADDENQAMHDGV
jgi:hypothetical protein